jgi:Zn-dependent protease with chaperone function
LGWRADFEKQMKTKIIPFLFVCAVCATLTAGYAPDGLRQCLQELQKHETPGAAFFPTHPPLQSRIAKLQAYETAGN